MAGYLQSLRIEYGKVSHYRTFWILLGVIAVCIPAFNYVVYDVTSTIVPPGPAQKILGDPFSYPNVWRTVPFNAGLLLFIPAILIITLTTNEYTYRTHRQNIIDGWSRTRFISLKLIETLLLTLFVTVIVVLTCLYFQLRTTNAAFTLPTGKELRYIAFFFLEMLDYSMIAVILGMLIRRAGLAMGIFFLYMIIEQFVVGILRNKYNQTWVDYLPEEVTDRLIPQPFGAKMISADKVTLWESHVSGYIAVSILYLLLFTFFVTWRFRKADL